MTDTKCCMCNTETATNKNGTCAMLCYLTEISLTKAAEEKKSKPDNNNNSFNNNITIEFDDEDEVDNLYPKRHYFNRHVNETFQLKSSLILQSCFHQVHLDCLRIYTSKKKNFTTCPKCERPYNFCLPLLIEDHSCEIYQTHGKAIFSLKNTFYSQILMEIGLLLNGAKSDSLIKLQKRFPWKIIMQFEKSIILKKAKEHFCSMENFIIQKFLTKKEKDPNNNSNTIVVAADGDEKDKANDVDEDLFQEFKNYFNETDNNKDIVMNNNIDNNLFHWDFCEFMISGIILFNNQPEEKENFQKLFILAYQFVFLQSFLFVMSQFSQDEMKNWMKYKKELITTTKEGSTSSNDDIRLEEKLIIEIFFIFLDFIDFELLISTNNNNNKEEQEKLLPNITKAAYEGEQQMFDVTRIAKEIKLKTLPFLRFCALLAGRQKQTNKFLPNFSTNLNQTNLQKEFDELLNYICNENFQEIKSTKNFVTFDGHVNWHAIYFKQYQLFPWELYLSKEKIKQFLDFNLPLSMKKREKIALVKKVRVNFEMNSSRLFPPNLIALPMSLLKIQEHFKSIDGIEFGYLCLQCGIGLRAIALTQHALYNYLHQHCIQQQHFQGIWLHVKSGLVWITRKSYFDENVIKWTCWGNLYKDPNPIESEGINNKETMKTLPSKYSLCTENYHLLTAQWITNSFRILIKKWKQM